MFYPLRENSAKPWGGGIHPLLYVRGLKLRTHLLSYEVVALHAMHNNKPNLFPLDPQVNI